MADENDENGHAPVPYSHFEGREWDRRFSDLARKMQQFPPEVQELLYAMRTKIELMERDARDFVPRSEIERIADKRTNVQLKALGFDIDHPAETAAQINWLMGLKRGVRGFMLLLITTIVGIAGTLLTTYITSHWSNK